MCTPLGVGVSAEERVNFGIESSEPRMLVPYISGEVTRQHGTQRLVIPEWCNPSEYPALYPNLGAQNLFWSQNGVLPPLHIQDPLHMQVPPLNMQALLHMFQIEGVAGDSASASDVSVGAAVGLVGLEGHQNRVEYGLI